MPTPSGPRMRSYWPCWATWPVASRRTAFGLSLRKWKAQSPRAPNPPESLGLGLGSRNTWGLLLGSLHAPKSLAIRFSIWGTEPGPAQISGQQLETNHPVPQSRGLAFVGHEPPLVEGSLAESEFEFPCADRQLPTLQTTWCGKSCVKDNMFCCTGCLLRTKQLTARKDRRDELSCSASVALCVCVFGVLEQVSVVKFGRCRFASICHLRLFWYLVGSFALNLACVCLITQPKRATT